MITAAVIALAALIAIARESGRQSPTTRAVGQPTASGDTLAATTGRPAERRPQDVIYRMIEAAGRGDTAVYLGCYSGSLRRRLEQSRDEMTPAGFGQYLAQTTRQIKGIAISGPDASSGREVEVRVEFVYQDRNEAQQFFLERSANDWKIARISAAERVETPVPFGSPVY